jgi:hypothetical protein
MTTIWLLCRQAPTKIPKERTPLIARLVIENLLISSSSGYSDVEVDPESSAEGTQEADPTSVEIFVHQWLP